MNKTCTESVELVLEILSSSGVLAFNRFLLFPLLLPSGDSSLEGGGFTDGRSKSLDEGTPLSLAEWEGELNFTFSSQCERGLLVLGGRFVKKKTKSTLVIIPHA